MSVVADNTVYPENVLLASGIASVNSLAFAGTIPGKRNSSILENSVASKGITETVSPRVKMFLFPFPQWGSSISLSEATFSLLILGVCTI